MSYPVTLFLTDLSQGMALMLSPSLLGKQINGVWHTSLSTHGREFYFAQGVYNVPTGTTQHGTPMLPERRILLGNTSNTKEQVIKIVEEMKGRYTPESYNILQHNCNNFTDELSQKLLNGTRIPQYIRDLPNEVINSPKGAAFRPLLESYFSNAAQSIQPQTPLSNLTKQITDPLPHPVHSGIHLQFDGIPPPHDLPIPYDYRTKVPAKAVTAFNGKIELGKVHSLNEVPILIKKLLQAQSPEHPHHKLFLPIITSQLWPAAAPEPQLPVDLPVKLKSAMKDFLDKRQVPDASIVLPYTDSLTDEIRLSLAPVLAIPPPRNKALWDQFWSLRPNATWDDVEVLIRSGEGGETARSHAVRQWASRLFRSTSNEESNTAAWAAGILQAAKDNTNNIKFGYNALVALGLLMHANDEMVDLLRVCDITDVLSIWKKQDQTKAIVAELEMLLAPAKETDIEAELDLD